MLRHRISIKKIEEKIVNGRRQGKEEIDFHNCYADALDLYGKELYDAINSKLENTAVFKIRYCKKIEELRNKEKFIVIWKDHKYKIYYPDFLGYKRDYIHLKCNEVL